MHEIVLFMLFPGMSCTAARAGNLFSYMTLLVFGVLSKTITQKLAYRGPKPERVLNLTAFCYALHTDAVLLHTVIVEGKFVLTPVHIYAL